ncbi:MAG: hypothetical protein ACXADS_15595 [Candidatus Thorarchaeota archaeon]
MITTKNTQRVITNKDSHEQELDIFFMPYFVANTSEDCQVFFTYAEHVHHFIIQKVYADAARSANRLVQSSLSTEENSRRQLVRSLENNIDDPSDVEAVFEFASTLPDFIDEFLLFVKDTLQIKRRTGLCDKSFVDEKTQRVKSDCLVIAQGLLEFVEETDPVRLEEKQRLHSQVLNRPIRDNLLRKIELLEDELDIERLEHAARTKVEDSPLLQELKEHFENCPVSADSDECEQLDSLLSKLMRENDVVAIEKGGPVDDTINMIARKLQAYCELMEKCKRFEEQGLVFDSWNSIISFTGMEWPIGISRCPLFYNLVEKLQQALLESTQERFLKHGI